MINTIKFILKHPLNREHKIKSLLRFFKWQLNNRLNPYPVVYPFTENSIFLMWRGLTGATGNLYCGLHEFQDMGFLLHFLRPTDLFADIGANVGSYTILASAEIGADTISIEPIPTTFKYLEDNILINRIQHRVRALNIGLGSNKGVIKFTQTLDTVNHVATKNEKDTIEVPVDTLDNIISDTIPVLLKIDVEGFESEVLKGAHNTLRSANLKAIIIELNGSGEKYGYNDSDIHEFLLELRFHPYDYNPFTRTLISVSTFGTQNTIYIRDVEFATERIINARQIKINNRLL